MRIGVLFSWCLLLIALRQTAVGTTWPSPATGQPVELTMFKPSSAVEPGTPLPVVFYLKNLSAPRIGTEADETILSDLHAAGHLVVVLDYAHHPQSILPNLTRDVVALRRQLQHKTLLADRNVDLAHVFIVPAGCRLRRDVVYYRDAARTLAMDMIYPSQPAQPTGAVLEFSCDNANRMGNFSLDFCTDTLLPLAAIAGHAAAMADHPVPAPYKGLDAMPDCARKIKAAVRTLRAIGTDLGLNGRIVPAGFSRGSGMALLLATTIGGPEFEGAGEFPGTDSRVQGAVVMSGRYTYLDLLSDDPMIPRYTQAWGSLADHADRWRTHGALDYLQSPAGFPIFLTINVSESPEARHQMEVIRRRFTTLQQPFIYAPETEPRGHKMPVAFSVLESIINYLQGRLQSASRSVSSNQIAP